MKKLSIQSPRRIANKIILLVLALELFSILLWGGLIYSGARDELIKSKSNQLSEIAYSTKIEISRFFAPIYIEAEVVSSAIVSDKVIINERLNSLLYSLIKRRAEIEEVSIIDNSGREVKRVSRMVGVAKNERRKFEDDPLIEDALLGKRSIASVEFTEYLEPVVRVGIPIKSDTGQELIILAVVNLKWLWDTVQLLQVGKSGYVYIVDESLKLVAHPDPSLVLSGMHLQSTTVPQSLFVEDEENKLQIYESIAGHTVAGISRFDPVHKWWIVVEQPVAEALAPLDRVIKRFILAFLLAIFLTVITVVYFSKLMMRPLENLEVAIDRLTQGGKEVRVDIPMNTELSSLLIAFNEMASNLEEKTEKLEYQADYDDLTKLPNRKRLFEHVDEVLGREVKNRKPFALLLLDLDRFKEINDSLGHKCGDLLLIELSDRLLNVMQEKGFIARLGGDEFAIVLESSCTIEKATDIAADIRSVIQKHFEIEGLRLLVDVSIGIAMYPDHGIDSTFLMRRADVAMYHAKKSGSGIAVYDETFDIDNSPERLALISELPKAIEEDELVLYYQPKIRVRDKKVIGVEALVRWDHPEHGLIPPDQFIPIVELGDSIIALTNWVINKAFLDCRKWQDQNIEIGIAINVSTLNIQDEGFVDHLSNMIVKHSINTNNIQLEITESIIMADTKRALKTINELDRMGIKISIDDFGTGYSSLAYLKELPVHELKIDKSFVIDVEENESDAVIVKSTIDLAHNLGLVVTAEGVETEGALALLDVLDCEYAQGFYISRPIPADKIVAWIEGWEKNNVSVTNTSLMGQSESPPV